jgi:glycosyltransferase involved in cell wall biosynthesis
MRNLFDARVIKGELTGVETYAIELLRWLVRFGDSRITLLGRSVDQIGLVRRLVGVDLPAVLARSPLANRGRGRLVALERDGLDGPSFGDSNAGHCNASEVLASGLPSRRSATTSPVWTDFDLLHCPTPIFPFFRKPPGLRVVCTVHDVTPRFAPQWHRRSHAIYFRWALPFFFSSVDQFLADSQASADDLVQYYQVSPSQINVIPLASRYSKEIAAAASPSVVSYSEPAKNFFLAVGTIEPRKNLENTVRGFLEFKRRNPDRDEELVLVGRSGWGNVPWRKIAAERSDVRWTGYLDDARLQELYRSARALVYPSLYEGFGLPVLEAMTFGCPVVTSPLSSLPEVGGDAALYVNPRDPQAIADALERLVLEPELAKSLASRGRARANLFSWERTARETLAAYRRTLDATDSASTLS